MFKKDQEGGGQVRTQHFGEGGQYYRAKREKKKLPSPGRFAPPWEVCPPPWSFFAPIIEKI